MLLQVVYGKQTTEFNRMIVSRVVEMNVDVPDNQQIDVRSNSLQDVVEVIEERVSRR